MPHSRGALPSCPPDVGRSPAPRDWWSSSESCGPSCAISTLPLEQELFVSESVSTLDCDLCRHSARVIQLSAPHRPTQDNVAELMKEGTSGTFAIRCHPSQGRWREGEKQQFVVSLIYASLVESFMCPDQGPSPQPRHMETTPYPAELPGQGCRGILNSGFRRCKASAPTELEDGTRPPLPFYFPVTELRTGGSPPRWKRHLASVSLPGGRGSRKILQHPEVGASRWPRGCGFIFHLPHVADFIHSFL